jgi:hypothetical protein
MTPRKDGSNQNLGERDLSSDFHRVNNEDELDTRDISNDIEEGDEDYDDEELDEELTEEDFDVDDDEEDNEDEII